MRRKPVTIRLDPTVLAQAVEAARRERRSLAGLVEMAVVQYLHHHHPEVLREGGSTCTPTTGSSGPS